MASNWIQQGDVPRVMIPLAMAQQPCGAPATRAYTALAYRADNTSGLVDSTLEQIAQDAGMSRTQAAAGVAALIKAGWIEQVRQGNSRRSNKYRMRATPVLDSAEIRMVNHPEIRTVQTAGPSGNPDQTIRKSGPPLVSSLLSPTTSPASGGVGDDAKTSKTPEYTAEFEAFWNAYPKRNGQRVGKKAAGREWTKALKSTTAEHLMAAVAKYAVTCNGFPKDAERFLRDEIWADLVPATTTGELSDEEIDEILGQDLTPLPALPPDIHPGSPEAKALRTKTIADRKADRRAQAARVQMRSQNRSIA